MRKLLIAVLLTGLIYPTFSQELDMVGQWKVQWHLVIDDQDYDHRYFIEESPLSPTKHVFNKDGSVTTTSETEQDTGLWRLEENRQLHITYRETKSTMIFICSPIDQDSFVAVRVMGSDPLPYFDVCLFERVRE